MKKTWMKMLARDKHASLFFLIISDVEKRFCEISPRAMAYTIKSFTVALNSVQ